MALPPKLDKSGFDILINEVAEYFGNKGLVLKFEGYKETLEQYSHIDFNDYNQCEEMARDFNMWGQYFAELEAYAEKLYLDAETNKIKEYAVASITADKVKVSNGDRLANKDESVVKARRTRNLLKAFYDLLESNKDYCYTSHHHCKDTCKWIKVGSGVIV